MNRKKLQRRTDHAKKLRERHQVIRWVNKVFEAPLTNWVSLANEIENLRLHVGRATGVTHLRHLLYNAGE